VVEKAQLGRSYEHGEEPIGERQKRQKTKNYSNRRGLHGLVRKGRSYLTKWGLVLWENRPLALKTRNASTPVGRQAGLQSGKTWVADRASCARGEREGLGEEIESTYLPLKRHNQDPRRRLGLAARIFSPFEKRTRGDRERDRERERTRKRELEISGCTVACTISFQLVPT
jgi:hypothetical protein